MAQAIINLGQSLADMLDQTANIKNLKASQVKKVLKEILLNEDIVSAFRMIMDGEITIPGTTVIDDLQTSLARPESELNPFTKGVLTRSKLNKKIDNIGGDTSISQPAKNILSVEFPDEDPDEDDPDFVPEVPIIEPGLPYSVEDDINSDQDTEANSASEESSSCEEEQSDTLDDSTLPEHQLLTQNSHLSEQDQDEEVYLDFLKNLFSDLDDSVPETADEPEFFTLQPVEPPSAGVDEDADDPEFDVMAELDRVYQEDFFDELRYDRGVRVSKTEARTLHQDLVEFLNDDVDEESSSKSVVVSPKARSKQSPKKLPKGLRDMNLNLDLVQQRPLESRFREIMLNQIKMHTQLLLSMPERGVCQIARAEKTLAQ
ncbi:hypothetical protein Ciccas_000536 [Cichlidogyrus casuarinus]|uniref:Uncharacterized protein n=1 Tax=Cichlidogyrus casuarinus TaxID=1844966 RepID=A0ABD2QMN0_9PLAT